MQYNPVAAAATAGYVGLAESRAAAVDSNTSRLLLVRARRNLGSAVVCQLIVLILCCAALAVPWSRITQYDSDGDAAITFSLYAGGKVVTCYPNLPGVSCQDSTTSDLAGEGWAAGPMLDVSSKASMGLVILMMLFSLFSIFAIAALRKRILVAAATASIAPAVTVPGRLAWSMRPFTPLYTLYIVGTLSTLNWLQFVICGKNFYSSNADNFYGDSGLSFSAGFIIIVVAGVFTWLASGVVRRAAWTVVAAQTRAAQARAHGAQATNAYAAAAAFAATPSPVPYATPVGMYNPQAPQGYGAPPQGYGAQPQAYNGQQPAYVQPQGYYAPPPQGYHGGMPPPLPPQYATGIPPTQYAGQQPPQQHYKEDPSVM